MTRKVDRDGLLAAFRAERGPSREVEERLWARLRADVDASPNGRLDASAPRRYLWGIAALAAAAAAIVVMRWPGGDELALQGADGTPSMAAHERSAVTDAKLAVPSPGSPVDAEPPREDPTHEAALEQSPEIEAAAIVEPDPRRPTTSRAQQRRSRGAEAQDSLAEETRLLRQARAALGQGEPQRALAVLSEYARAHPSGQLTEEADAVRTIAKCRLQPTEGRELARSFSVHHRGSLFRGQVQTACGTDEGK